MRARSLERTAAGVVKTTDDADHQVAWLEAAAYRAVVKGVRPVQVLRHDNDGYLMEFLPGPALADVVDTDAAVGRVRLLLAQVAAWSGERPDNEADWDQYLERLRRHATCVRSRVAMRAVDVIADHPPFPRSWCHGDLTLENVICEPDGIVLIDPNYSPDLYQSYILDYGKILQSTHTSFHRLLSRRTGPLDVLGSVIEEHLRESGQYQAALQACLSHTIRLLRHWPAHQSAVESSLTALLEALGDRTVRT